MGAFHAAGRAVSGAPVYVSDKPGEHDFAVLRKLVLSDGSVPRPGGIGRPTRDCIYRDPTGEDVLLKVFNLNLEAGVVGAFNARYEPDEASTDLIEGTVSPSDVYGLPGSDFAVYAHHARTLVPMTREERLAVRLAPLTAEVFTIGPVDGGVAPVGLADKYNSAGAISAKGWEGKVYVISVRDGGTFVAWSERKPSAVLSDGAEQRFSYEKGALFIDLAKAGPQTVRMRFD
jgi:raffinose synthase